MKIKPNLGIVVNSLYFNEPKYIENQGLVYQKLSKYFEVYKYDDGFEKDIFGSITTLLRIGQFNEASKNCEMLLSHAGGFNAIEILAESKKLRVNKNTVFIGSSDGTILANALLTLGAKMSIYGPDFMKMVFDIEYADEMIESIFSIFCSDYAALSRNIDLRGYKVLQAGEMKDVKILGGNNYTFDLLQGTPFCPSYNEPFVLLLEGEYSQSVVTKPSEIFSDFIRNIDSLLLQPNFAKNIKGILLGRFPDIEFPREYYEKFLNDRSKLMGMPIAYDLSIGHCKGALAIPLGTPLSINITEETFSISKSRKV